MELVLASGSPRRAELLESVGWLAVIVPPEVDESQLPDESATEYVLRLSAQKALTVAFDYPSSVVVAADTAVELDGEVLGKPADERAARAMIERLSGRSHRVHTGVTVVGPDSSGDTVVTTTVTFGTLSAEEVSWYVEQGESLDKAGAYALQGAGAVLVERVDGSVTNVIGLPLRETINLVRAAVLQATLPAVADAAADNAVADAAVSQASEFVPVETDVSDIETYDAEDLPSIGRGAQPSNERVLDQGQPSRDATVDQSVNASGLPGDSSFNSSHDPAVLGEPEPNDRRLDEGAIGERDGDSAAGGDERGRSESDDSRRDGVRRSPLRRVGRRRHESASDNAAGVDEARLEESVVDEAGLNESGGDVVRRRPLFERQSDEFDSTSHIETGSVQADVESPLSEGLNRAREYFDSDDFAEADARAHADADREFVIGGPLDSASRTPAPESASPVAGDESDHDATREVFSPDHGAGRDDDPAAHDAGPDGRGDDGLHRDDLHRDDLHRDDLHRDVEMTGDGDAEDFDADERPGERVSPYRDNGAKLNGPPPRRSGDGPVPTEWSIHVRSHGQRRRSAASRRPSHRGDASVERRSERADENAEVASAEVLSTTDRDRIDGDRNPRRYRTTAGSNHSVDVGRGSDPTDPGRPSGRRLRRRRETRDG